MRPQWTAAITHTGVDAGVDVDVVVGAAWSWARPWAEPLEGAVVGGGVVVVVDEARPWTRRNRRCGMYEEEERPAPNTKLLCEQEDKQRAFQ